MGAIFPVAIAQFISTTILRSAALNPPKRFTSFLDSTIPEGTAHRVPYTYSIKTVSTSIYLFIAATRVTINTFSSFALIFDMCKAVWEEGEAPAETLCLWWWKEGVLTVKLATSARLSFDTESDFTKVFSTGRFITSFVFWYGHVFWNNLSSRPCFNSLFSKTLFSIFKASSLWTPFCGTLNSACNVYFPTRTCAIPFVSRSYAIDAGKTGDGGFVYCYVDYIRSFLYSVSNIRYQRVCYYTLVPDLLGPDLFWYSQEASNLSARPDDVMRTYIPPKTLHSVSVVFSNTIRAVPFKTATCSLCRFGFTNCGGTLVEEY